MKINYCFSHLDGPDHHQKLHELRLSCILDLEYVSNSRDQNWQCSIDFKSANCQVASPLIKSRGLARHRQNSESVKSRFSRGKDHLQCRHEIENPDQKVLSQSLQKTKMGAR